MAEDYSKLPEHGFLFKKEKQRKIHNNHKIKNKYRT